jgi:hypothetical protein
MKNHRIILVCLLFICGCNNSDEKTEPQVKPGAFGRFLTHEQNFYESCLLNSSMNMGFLSKKVEHTYKYDSLFRKNLADMESDFAQCQYIANNELADTFLDSTTHRILSRMQNTKQVQNHINNLLPSN